MAGIIKISEREVQKQIVDGLRIAGWKCYRINNGGICNPKTGQYFFHGTKGFCDIVAIKKDRMLMIECKRPKGLIRPEQKEFINLINSVESVRGVIAYSFDDILKLI